MRSRRKEVNGLGVENREEAPSYHYKRGYFIDWIVCDNLKKKVLPKVDYWLDTHIVGTPKMISGEILKEGLDENGAYSVPGSTFLRSGSLGRPMDERGL